MLGATARTVAPSFSRFVLLGARPLTRGATEGPAVGVPDDGP